MLKVIFISGIHGSGKTTLGQKLSQKMNLSFDSASNIIKKMNQINWDQEKRVSNINKNQDVLLAGINKLYSKEELIILDGHFTLIDSEYQINYLPIEIFQNLNMSYIICCITPLETVLERLKERDGNNTIKIDEIRRFHQAELMHAKNIANQLNVPVISYNTEMEELEYLITTLIKGER
ncbi:ATP-binding protein [Metabacillus sp. 84]|uniref:ATP-binding protein n=1 Tax=Metabacillus sp. 84 TaxID=3404705 RepID=UPI003CF203F1